MDLVFRALSDPSRREILDRLNERSGQSLSELCAGLDMRRQSVTKHLAVLEAANLVTTVRRGREKLHYLNPAPINDIADRWIRRYDRTRVEALADMKRALEETGMEQNDFVYVSYIRATPERVWHALTEPEFTRRYWEGWTFECDWKAGSKMTWVNGDLRVDDPEQVVLAYDPYTTLAYTWHGITPGFVAKYDFDKALAAKLAAESRSKVTFSLEPQGEMVKLTVTHGGFKLGSTMREMVQNGWPGVISSLKTLLETGDVLERHEHAGPKAVRSRA